MGYTLKVPMQTLHSFIPNTCKSSPPIPLALKEHGIKGPLIHSLLINDTVAPVSTKHFRLDEDHYRLDTVYWQGHIKMG